MQQNDFFTKNRVKTALRVGVGDILLRNRVRNALRGCKPVFGKSLVNSLCVKALSKNPVISADLLDSCHSFIRVVRDKIGTKRSRMMANATNLSATKSECFH